MPQWLKAFLPLVIILGPPLIKGILSAIDRYAKKRQMEIDREKRIGDAFRTGRVIDQPATAAEVRPTAFERPMSVPPPLPTPAGRVQAGRAVSSSARSTTAQQALEEIALRRQQRLEELARGRVRQQGAGTSSAPLAQTPQTRQREQKRVIPNQRQAVPTMSGPITPGTRQPTSPSRTPSRAAAPPAVPARQYEAPARQAAHATYSLPGPAP